MKIHIYTDASCKDTTTYSGGILRTTKVGVIVVDSHILDIYYKRRDKFFTSNIAEKDAILESINYVKRKYNTSKIIVHTDSQCILSFKVIKKLLKDNPNIIIKYVKGHCSNRKGLKYKFNCLSDWISKHGTSTWKNYYYRHLL